jgi:glutamate N-acetyltransferase/amino-acid N-acetyltransferase
MAKERLPRGFLLSTAEAAIKRPGKKDMALILSAKEANISGAFTTNKVKGAPVMLDMRRIKSGKGRAVIINSGNANACTGKKGMDNAREMAGLASKALGIDEKLVYVSSTGVIGAPMPMERIRPKIAELASGIGGSTLRDAASAIMTTDTFPKFISKEISIGGRRGVIAGICKGAGMIYPDMATMLCFLMTDVAIDKNALDRAFKDSVEKSFNRITIDGDRSTSDTALILSNGMLGNNKIKTGTKDYSVFKRKLDEATYELSRMVATDGEGATKLIEVEIKGAKNPSQAKNAAFAIANSNLFKTAVYGNDANWGRIMAALGSSGINMKEQKTDILFGKIMVAKDGLSTGRDKEAGMALRSKEVKITVNLKSGGSSCKVLTCDLTEAYVRINAEYRT